MTTLRTGLLCGAALLASWFGMAAPAAAGEISIGHTTWVGYGPLYLARDLGYFKELGLTVDLPVNEEQGDSFAAQAAGHMDGGATTVDDLLAYRKPEFCFKAVVALDESHGGDGIVARPEITGIKDLKGRTIALNEGSTSQFFLDYLLKKEGLSQADVTLSNMTADDASAAFIAGRVPVAVTWEPNITFVRTHNAGKVLVDSSSAPGIIVDVVELSCSVIEKHPEDVKALVTGYYKALDYIKSNRDKAYEIMAKGVGGYLSKPEDIAQAMKGVRFYDRPMNIAYFGSPQKPGPIAETIGLANDIWGSVGKISMKADYPTLVAPEFVAAGASATN